MSWKVERFNPVTTLRYTLPRAQRIRLVICDVAGWELATLATGTMAAGEHVGQWRGRDGRGRALPSGDYLARLEVEGRTLSRKLVLAR